MTWEYASSAVACTRCGYCVGARRLKPRRLIVGALITDADMRTPVDYATFLKLDPLEWCARCGSCQSMCPAVHMSESADTYIGPAGMIAIGLRHFDPYDTGDRVSQAVQEGLWNCIMCGKCDEVCPALEIDHIGTWTALREEATKRDLTEKKPPILPFG